MVCATTRSRSSTNTAAGRSARTSRTPCATRNRGRCRLPSTGTTTVETLEGRGQATVMAWASTSATATYMRDTLRDVIDATPAGSATRDVNLDPLREAINFTYPRTIAGRCSNASRTTTSWTTTIRGATSSRASPALPIRAMPARGMRAAARKSRPVCFSRRRACR